MSAFRALRRTSKLVYLVAVALAPRLAIAAPAAHPATAPIQDGTWIGTRPDGSVVVWEFSGSRLRIEERRADTETRADSLIVRFDRPPGAPPGSAREKAVYRFIASSTGQGPARLFVYGFDLGRRGLHFVRESSAPRLPEDTTPPTPSPDSNPMSRQEPQQKP
jgi:hypothetical protein